MHSRLLALAPALLCATSLHAQETPVGAPVLPPVMPWSGASENLIVAKDDPWITPIEANAFLRTPSYEETSRWLDRLVAHSGLLSRKSFGTSAEGRDLYFIRASRDPSANRPVVLVQAGIHSFEIDGKDAGMMLLRDIALRGKDTLLDQVDLVFVPIYNVDGHELVAINNAPHSRGPENGGTVDTAQHINLNRDYAKAAAPETRAMLALLQELDPVLYLDMHVSGGFDHGYDVTYTYAGWGRHVQSDAINRWLGGAFEMQVNAYVQAQGHTPHFYPSAFDDHAIEQGLRMSAEGPRYSTGYGDYTRIPTVLVEMHNLKPYRQRVLGAYAMIEGALRAVSGTLPKLQEAIASDRASRPETLAVAWERDAEPFTTIDFTGVAFERYLSAASGAEETRYLGRTEDWRLPVTGQHPVQHVTLPRAWWVPAAETQVIALLDRHGIAYERIEAPRKLALDMTEMTDIALGPVYDAQVRMQGTARHAVRQVTMPAGSVRVAYDQPRGLLAAALLEPEAPDSLFAWGFFPELMEKGGHRERFIVAATAERMLERDPQLRNRFEARLKTDPDFAADPQARLDWLASQSDYLRGDPAIYPIGRELKRN